MRNYRTALIYVRDQFAGILSETDEGYSSSYDTEYLNKCKEMKEQENLEILI